MGETDKEKSDFQFDKARGTIPEYNSDAPKNVVIPSEIDGIKVKNMGRWF